MKLIARISIAIFILYWVLPVSFSLYLTKTAPAIAKQVPTDLSDQSVSEAPGIKLSYFGREFEIPWTDVDDSQTKVETRQDHQMVWICFRSGLKLFVWITPHRKTAFNYAFLKRAYAITPDKIHSWSFSSHQRYEELILLRLKASFLEDIGLGMSSNPAEAGVFNVRGQGYQGFQYGNPKVRPGMLELRLYDDDDASVEIKFLQMGYDEPAGVTQPEINRIVQSLRQAGTKITSTSD